MVKEANVPVPPKGEHIFPATYLEPLAIRWKELNAQGNHEAAMQILEQIVIGSTQMFKVLAQHEGYHYTVDLDILVVAAQEKVVKWLLSWQRRKGRLFKWFNKSFSADTWVLLADGSCKKIVDIVNNRLPLDVLTWNRSTGAFEPKPIINWIKSPATGTGLWRRLSVKFPKGNQPKNWKDCPTKKFVMTRDHEVYTDRGRVRIEDLKPSDSLFICRPNITPDGMSALIGMYLGDGHVSKNGYFVVAHGKPQENYTRFIARQFGNRKVWPSKIWLKWKQKATGKIIKRQYDVFRTRILMHRVWKNCQLTTKKKITTWLLDNINPVVLAYWYMDDGTLEHVPKTGRYFPFFCSECFSGEEHRQIAERLEFEWGIATWLKKEHTEDSTGRLAVRDSSTDRFFRMIAPYLLPDFDYKIPSQYRHIEKNKLEFLRYESVACQEFKVQKLRVLKENLAFRYDITVADNHNIVIAQSGKSQNGSSSGLCVTQCAKNAFLSELVKVNQFRKRYHVTSDDFEKFIGAEDHAINRNDAAMEAKANLATLTCRWGSPQEIGAIHYLIECILEDDHDKQAAIRGSAYAWGISMDMAKFFYSWALVSMRDQMYKKIRVPFTEEDLVRAVFSYSDFVSLFDLENTPFTWPIHGKYLCAVYGGKRIKIPTIAQIAAIREAKQIFDEVESSDKDPDSVAEAGERHGKNARTAQDLYNQMVEDLDPKRSGEYDVYGTDHHH